MDCDVSDLDKPATAAGINMIAWAKIIGITPEALLQWYPLSITNHPVQNHLK
jgi:hypothetical protein